MNKPEYLKELRKRLYRYDPQFSREILDAFNAHFEEGIKEGRTEDEIIDDLGPIDDVMDNIRMMHPDHYTNTEKKSDFEDIKGQLSNLGQELTDAFSSLVRFTSDTIENAVNNSHSHTHKADRIPLTLDESCHILTIQADKGCTIHIHRSDIASFAYGDNRRSRIDPQCGSADIGFHITENNAALDLAVPAQIDELMIHSNSGDILLEGLTLKDAIVKLTSGDIDVNDCHVTGFSVNTTSGDIHIDGCQSETLVVKATSGDIEISRTEADLQTETGSGDVQIDGHIANAVRIQSKAGDIHYEGTVSTAELKTLAGDIAFRTESSFHQVLLGSLGGDIDLHIPQSLYTAELSTKSGDINFPKSQTFEKQGRRHYMVGLGEGLIKATTLSGDINI